MSDERKMELLDHAASQARRQWRGRSVGLTTREERALWSDYFRLARAAWIATWAERAARPADVWPTPRTVVAWAERRKAS